MPLHLEKVRDKLAENIHELWGMNKIELGWSYGKVRSTCICVVGEKNQSSLWHPWTLFSGLWRDEHHGRAFFSVLFCFSNFQDVWVVWAAWNALGCWHLFPKTESSKACPSSCFLFYNLRFTPKSEGKWKDTHSSPPRLMVLPTTSMWNETVIAVCL